MQVESQIVEHLLNDSRFNFKEIGQFLQKGTCPDCNKNELYIRKSQPYILKCNRLNHCSYEENTRAIYPEIFQQFSKLYPTTEKNPQATADAYMQFDRQFNITTIKHWYSQESYRLPKTSQYIDTVRFYFDDERTRYWERLIDKAKADGQRFNIGGKRKGFPKSHRLYNDYNGSLYKGEWWKPKDIKIRKGDVVYLVEGILHALALYFAGHKTAAIIGASNFPSLAIEPYLNKDIIWRLALDDDLAGRSNMLKHAKKLRALNQKVEFILTGETKLDWDDLFRAGRLTDRFIDDCLYRGRLFGSETIKEKAYHWYCKNNRVYAVLDFKHRYYSITIDGKLHDELALFAGEGVEIRDCLNTQEGEQIFRQNVSATPITNCKPEFLYCEQQQITGELAYFFSVSFPSMPERKIALTGSALESPNAFNKSLLNQAPGAGFDGSTSDFKTIKDRWFNDGVLIVETVPFLGYDKHSQSYIFNNWGYRQGRALKLTSDGYFEAGQQRIKSSFKSFQIQQSSEAFNPDWLSDFAKVFGNQGMVGLSFWFGSLFAQQIRAKLKDFPFLELTGEHGAGKSTLIEFLWKLVGRDDYEGFDPSKATFAARTRAFSQVSNLPIVLIESDHGTEDKAKKGQFDFEELKTAFNGRAIRSIGSFNRGNDIEEPSFNASIVIAQNASVDGSPALLSRIVHCHCTKEHFSPETKALAPKFAEASIEQMASFIPAVLEKEQEILAHFFTVFSTLDEQLCQRGTVKDGRIVKTHSMVAAMASALRFIFPNYDDEWNNRLQAYIFNRAESRQQRMNADHPLVQQFWEIYDFINSASEKQSAFSLKQHLNHASKEGQIAINLNHFYQTCRDRNIELIATNDLKKLLPSSQRHKYIGTKNVRSNILEKAVHCMVFTKGNNG